MNSQNLNKTPVVVIGTLGELEQGFSSKYAQQLFNIVQELKPELLIAEIPRTNFERASARLPLEYQQVLLPLAQFSDTVVVPVGSPPAGSLLTPRGGLLLSLRRLLVDGLNDLLIGLQGQSPQRINSPLYGLACGYICHGIGMLCGPTALKDWQAQNQQLLENVLAAIQQDPGRRIVVTLDCRRKHQLLGMLARVPEVQLLDYRSALRQSKSGGPACC